MYSDSLAIGEPVSDNYCNEIEKSNFFVPVITPDYTKLRKHIHVHNELSFALNRNDKVFKMSNGRFMFVFPYAPEDGEQLLDKIPGLAGKIYAGNLAKIMIKNSPFTLFANHSFGFEIDWPGYFFDSNGGPDLLIVPGRWGKENPPEEEDIKNLKTCSIEEDLIKRYDDALLDSGKPTLPTQSLRIAEYLPRFIQFFSNKFLALNPTKRE